MMRCGLLFDRFGIEPARLHVVQWHLVLSQRNHVDHEDVTECFGLGFNLMATEARQRHVRSSSLPFIPRDCYRASAMIQRFEATQQLGTNCNNLGVVNLRSSSKLIV